MLILLWKEEGIRTQVFSRYLSIATECGVIKNGMEEPRFEEIEILAVTVRERIRQS